MSQTCTRKIQGMGIRLVWGLRGGQTTHRHTLPLPFSHACHDLSDLQNRCVIEPLSCRFVCWKQVILVNILLSPRKWGERLMALKRKKRFQWLSLMGKKKKTYWPDNIPGAKDTQRKTEEDYFQTETCSWSHEIHGGFAKPTFPDASIMWRTCFKNVSIIEVK